MKVLNWELNEIIINDFCDSFTAEIKQIIMNNKIKVMCTEEKFIETIIHYNIKIFKKEELKITNEIFKAMIKNMLMWVKKKIW